MGTLLLICVLRAAKGSSPSLVVAAARFALQVNIRLRAPQLVAKIVVVVAIRFEGIALA